jgi:hypothetical protein
MTVLKFPRGRNEEGFRTIDHPPCLCESCLDAAYLAMGERTAATRAIRPVTPGSGPTGRPVLITVRSQRAG